MATGTVKKHIGIYNDQSEFEQDRDNGVLVAPYVAYLRLKDDNGNPIGYRLYHSSDSNLERCETNAIQDIDNKFSKLENRFQTLKESEYDIILSNLEAGNLGENDDIQVTPIGSAQCTVKYSPVVCYCTYED